MRSLLWVILLLLPLSVQGADSAYPVDDDLSYHITFGRAEDIKILLDKGSNPNASSPQGDTMLTIAVVRNDSEGVSMVEALLDKGADPNLPDKNKNYPLVLAARNGQVQMVTALMAKGADFHARTSSGTPVIDVAKQNGNPEIIKIIQDALDKEAAYAASLRSPERFREIVRQYAFHSCQYQYWNYYLSSRQDPDKDTDTQKKINDHKSQLADLMVQIQKYYPSTKIKNLQEVSDQAAQTIFSMLDSMVSNRYRAEKSVGQDDDAKQRCQTIATSLKIDFIPADLK